MTKAKEAHQYVVSLCSDAVRMALMEVSAPLSHSGYVLAGACHSVLCSHKLASGEFITVFGRFISDSACEQDLVMEFWVLTSMEARDKEVHAVVGAALRAEAVESGQFERYVCHHWEGSGVSKVGSADEAQMSQALHEGIHKLALALDKLELPALLAP